MPTYRKYDLKRGDESFSGYLWDEELEEKLKDGWEIPKIERGHGIVWNDAKGSGDMKEVFSYLKSQSSRLKPNTLSPHI